MSALPQPVTAGQVNQLAKSILRTAQTGERDTTTLQRLALLELQLMERCVTARVSPPSPPVAEVAMVGALHDRLRARQLDVVAESVSHRKIRGADQQEAESARPAPGRTPHSRIADVDRKGIRRLFDHVIVERVIARVGFER